MAMIEVPYIQSPGLRVAGDSLGVFAAIGGTWEELSIAGCSHGDPWRRWTPPAGAVLRVPEFYPDSDCWTDRLSLSLPDGREFSIDRWCEFGYADSLSVNKKEESS